CEVFDAVVLLSKLTKCGDVTELDSFRESSAVWRLVTSTVENCLGQKCAFWDDCHLVKARRAAQDADIVVINHHLMLADLVLKEEGFGELLPGADIVIVDEAHQFPETAAQHFGVSVSSRQLRDLVQDMKSEYLQSAGDVPGVPDRLEELEAALKTCRDAFGKVSKRIAWQCTDEPETGEKQLEAIRFALQNLLESSDGLRNRARGLDNCIERAERFHDRFEDFLGSGDENDVRWIETYTTGFSLNTVPLDTAGKLATIWESHPASWIFTSASLAVNNDLGHFRARIGMPDAETAILDSPFDYANNTLLYLPENLPGPGEDEHTESVVQVANQFIDIAGGGTFLLFTSYRAMNYAAQRLEEIRPDTHLLVQKSAPKNSLLEEFRNHGNAVLLGTTSFWEGVDVKGTALRLVVIDKLPFASPGDPLTAAKIEACRQRGGNPFAEFQLPQAVIGLKQGIGRLIRDADDHGLFIICDPRLVTKSYGKVFLGSLPPIPVTRDPQKAEQFMLQLNQTERKQSA
ncbi:MAG: ATP-dependent DNA helicase, partial [Gammaproteobacteria bacterium]